MTFALWLVGAVFALVIFGTWAIQITVWLLAVALRLAGALAVLLFGLVSLLALGFLDRRQLARIWRNERQSSSSTIVTIFGMWRIIFCLCCLTFRTLLLKENWECREHGVREPKATQPSTAPNMLHRSLF